MRGKNRTLFKPDGLGHRQHEKTLFCYILVKIRLILTAKYVYPLPII